MDAWRGQARLRACPLEAVGRAADAKRAEEVEDPNQDGDVEIGVRRDLIGGIVYRPPDPLGHLVRRDVASRFSGRWPCATARRLNVMVWRYPRLTFGERGWYRGAPREKSDRIVS